MANLSNSEFLNLALALTNYQVVVAAIFRGLAVAVGLTELPVTEGRTDGKVAQMVVVAEIAAWQLDLAKNS
jgi:hypothetical protein